MKKIFLMASTALLVCASCSNDILLDEPQVKNTEGGREINFSTFVERGTRASKPAGFSFNVDDEMAVYGFEYAGTTENLLFDNTRVTNVKGNTDDEWDYSPKKYWSAGSSYKFYAAYPYAQNFAFNTTDKLFSLASFTVADATDDQVDLMLAEQKNSEPNELVEFTFHHILSNVNFYAKVSTNVKKEDIAKIEVTKFDVKQILSTGSYAQTSWAADNQAVGAWTPGTGYYNFPEVTSAAPLALAVEDYPTEPVATDLLLMPQKLFTTNSVATTDPFVEVEFKVCYTDGATQTFSKTARLAGIKSYQMRTLQADGTYTPYASQVDPISEWLPNYKYNYTISFDPTRTRRVWDSDSDGGLGSSDDEKTNEKEGGSKYDPDDPDHIQVFEDTDGDGIPDTWVEEDIVWEDIDGDGNLEGGVDRDGDGHIDNVDGDKHTEWNNDPEIDPTDGDDVNNPDGKDVILVYVDTDGDGEPDDWHQLEKDPETGEIIPEKEYEDNTIEFTAEVSDWAVEYGIGYDVTK